MVGVCPFSSTIWGKCYMTVESTNNCSIFFWRIPYLWTAMEGWHTYLLYVATFSCTEGRTMVLVCPSFNHNLGRVSVWLGNPLTNEVYIFGAPTICGQHWRACTLILRMWLHIDVLSPTYGREEPVSCQVATGGYIDLVLPMVNNNRSAINHNIIRRK